MKDVEPTSTSRARVATARVANASVAISTMDRPDALGRCLDALLAGDVLPAEIVVVDQGRDDRALQAAEARRSRGAAIVHVRQEPRGLGASQNLAVARARCPVVAVTDDDCIADPRWLATIEETFASNSALDGVTGRILPLDPEGDRLYPVSSRTDPTPAEFSGKSLPWLVGSGNNFAVKREWYLRIGGCDERLGPGSAGNGGVDMDLFYRLLRAGARIRYEPRSLVYHERQTRPGRTGRRPMYGYGMGACCMLRLREGDLYAIGMLGRWVGARARRLAGAMLRGRWTLGHEEWLMLAGTVGGLVYGLRAPALSGRTAAERA